jgi:hypothetical protein
MKTKLAVLLLPCIPLHVAKLPHGSVELLGEYQSEARTAPLDPTDAWDVPRGSRRQRDQLR